MRPSLIFRLRCGPKRNRRARTARRRSPETKVRWQSHMPMLTDSALPPGRGGSAGGRRSGCAWESLEPRLVSPRVGHICAVPCWARWSADIGDPRPTIFSRVCRRREASCIAGGDRVVDLPSGMIRAGLCPPRPRPCIALVMPLPSRGTVKRRTVELILMRAFRMNSMYTYTPAGVPARRHSGLFAREDDRRAQHPAATFAGRHASERLRQRIRARLRTKLRLVLHAGKRPLRNPRSGLVTSFRGSRDETSSSRQEVMRYTWACQCSSSVTRTEGFSAGIGVGELSAGHSPR